MCGNDEWIIAHIIFLILLRSGGSTGLRPVQCYIVYTCVLQLNECILKEPEQSELLSSLLFEHTSLISVINTYLGNDKATQNGQQNRMDNKTRYVINAPFVVCV